MTDWKPGFYTDGYESFSRADDAEEAQEAADDIIDIYREGAEGDEWNEDVGYVHYGICLPLGIATQEPVDDELFEDAVDYHLREPEIDAAAFWATVTEHAPKLAEALAGHLQSETLARLTDKLGAIMGHLKGEATDPIAKLEAWRSVDPALRSYGVGRCFAFHVELKNEWQDIFTGQGETLPEAVDAALEAAKRGAT